MSFTTAFSNSVSGLRASSKMAETLSSNIANSMTEGYARRELNLVAAQLDGSGRGVFVQGVTVIEDKLATMSRRDMGARAAADNVAMESAAHVNNALGDVHSPLALARMMGELEASFVSAANAPENLNFVRDIAQKAAVISDRFNAVSQDFMQIRQDADTQIAIVVENLNRSLIEVERLNLEIAQSFNSDGDTSGFKAERQRLIDEISEIVPVNVINKERGRVALFTHEGGSLLDYYRTDFSFTQSPMITPGMSFAGGALSGLMVNGVPVDIMNSNGVWAGGTLEAHFKVRDETIPTVNAQLDGLARDLIERFQDPATDPTLGALDAGIFTDNGGRFDVVNEVGLAGRISLNTLVGANSADLWRLQSGLNAAVPLNAGDASILMNYASVIQEARVGNAGLGTSIALGAAGFAGKIAADAGTDWGRAETRASYSATQAQVLREKESNAIGVDSDVQLQMLMEVENAYAANARVISVLDQMLAKLMEI